LSTNTELSQAARGEQLRAVPPKPLIQIVNLCKSFGSQKVLDGVNLDLYPAQTTVVLGPSGTGKSVLLKCIIGLLRPDSGEIWFDGQRIDQLPERDLRDIRLQIGLLFQMGALFDSMNVADNIAFPLVEHNSCTKDQIPERVAAALDMVDLAGVQSKLPAQLSGGQRKRVALARAIVIQPRVVLYDEPTTGLDPVRADGINELVIKLKRTLGVTGIVVTHDLTSAKKVADRVVMLLGGKVIAQGTFEQLTRSSDLRVRHFFAGEYTAELDNPDAEVRPNKDNWDADGRVAGKDQMLS
jgi:phospholipid/cholesterol/gamma-HCH transport system ATP-binding protein